MEREMEETMRMIKEAEMRTGCIMPLYNVTESEREYVVTVDMPGVRKEDIEIEVFENGLMVEAPCRPDIPSGRYGNRYRLMVELPSGLDTSSATARYLHGVLEVKVSKKGARGTKIKVE